MRTPLRLVTGVIPGPRSPSYSRRPAGAPFDPLTDYDWYVDSVWGSDASVTNILPWSHDFTEWAINPTNSQLSGSSSGPFPGELAYLLEDISASGLGAFVMEGATPADTEDYTFSVFIREDATPTVYPAIQIEMAVGGTYTLATRVIEPATGAVSDSDENAGGGVLSSGSETFVIDGTTWHRVWVSVTNTGNTAIFANVVPAYNTDGGVSRNNAAEGGHYFAAAQVNIGSGPQAYVSTGGESATNTFDGTTAATAFKTLAEAVAVFSASETLAVANGSTFRENWNDLSMHGGTILTYGDGAKPKFRGDDIAVNANFTPHTTEANVYEISWTLGEEGTQSYTSVWVDGVRLQRVATGDVTSTAGSYFAPNPDGVTGTYTIKVHPPGSTNPTTDGKVYEITKRMTVLALGNNWTISGIRTMRNGAKNGSLWVGTGSTISDCIFEDGVIHNALIGPGTMTDCYAWKTDRADIIGQNNMIQGNTSGGSGETLHFLRTHCIGSIDPALGTGGGQPANTQGIHVHSDGNSTPYATVTIEDCYGIYLGGGFSITNTQNARFIGCALFDTLGGLGGQGQGVAGGGKMYVQDCRIYGEQRLSLLRSIQNTPEELHLGDESTDTPAGIFAHKTVSGGAIYLTAGTAVKQMYRGVGALINYVSGNRNEVTDTGACPIEHRVGWIQDGWLNGWNLANASSSVTGSDGNTIFPSTSDQKVAGTNYADYAAYAAATSQDATSDTTDPGTVSSGGSQEPIITAPDAPAGHGPVFAGYTADLTKSTYDTLLGAA